jgi:hypothetical protein
MVIRMGMIFSFEREMHATLDLMPFAVRRKLDLAGVKLSLDGWKALPVEDRRALRDAHVETDAEVVAFAGLLRSAAARAGASVTPLPDVPAEPPWRTRAVPAPLRARIEELRAALRDDLWAALDDEDRYVLFRLAEKKREPERLLAALREVPRCAEP